jgi:3-carboxy-cis,cis-muconate cycloisomerase
MTDLRSVLAGGAPTEDIFSAASLFVQMLAVEGALARAHAAVGAVPATAAERIATACADPSWIDTEQLLVDTATAGTPVIPLVAALRARVGSDDAHHVHRGATSQDIVDTATALQLHAGLDALDADLHRIAANAAAFAEQHRATPMVGRTLLRHAAPITLGLKAARWLATSVRALERTGRVREELVVQLGGAVGTAEGLGAAVEDAAAVEADLAAQLGLGIPDLPWHTERDRPATVITTVGVVAASLGKIAGDLLLLSTEEVAEVDVAGGGGSTALPHKRNPTDLVLASAAARLCAGAVSTYLHALDQEHERAAGGWQVEWAVTGDAFRAAGAAAHRVAAAMASMTFDPARMEHNLQRTRGLVLSASLAGALAAEVGLEAAQRLVQHLAQEVSRSQRTLAEVAAADAVVTDALGDRLHEVLDPRGALGSSDRFIDAALAGHARLSRRAEA